MFNLKKLSIVALCAGALLPFCSHAKVDPTAVMNEVRQHTKNNMVELDRHINAVSDLMDFNALLSELTQHLKNQSGELYRHVQALSDAGLGNMESRKGL